MRHTRIHSTKSAFSRRCNRLNLRSAYDGGGLRGLRGAVPLALPPMRLDVGWLSADAKVSKGRDQLQIIF